MKKCLLLLFAFGIFSNAFTQTQPPPALTVDFVSYGSSPFWYGETISFNYEWKLNGSIDKLPQSCAESYSVLDNGGATIVKRTGNNVDVTWGAQKSTTARVNINLTQCSTSAYNKSYSSPNYSVMSIVGETPGAINGTSNVPVCQSSPLTYSTTAMSIPNGVNRAADGYEWTIPVGWKFADGTVSNGTPKLFLGTSGRTQQFTPDCRGSGAVIVRAWTNTEGRGTPHYSLPRSLAITRTPNIAISAPAEIKCGIPFQASLPELACASSYSWTVPSGWTVTGTGRVVTITPAGTAPGTISARANLTGGCVVHATDLNVTPSKSGTITGPPAANVCLPSTTYTFAEAPTNSIITWSVSPANRVVTASGTGTTANLVPSSNPGMATLTFTVSGACSYTVSKMVSVGAIQTSDIFISAFDEWTGGYPYVCPNGVYVTTIHPVNENYTYEVQVTNGFATPFGQSPGMFVININSYIPSQYADAAVSARVNNGCGWSDWRGISLFSDPFACPPGGGGCSPGSGDICLLLYPNPSSEEVSVSLLGIEENEMKTGQKLGEGMIYLYDSNGTLRKSASISKEKTLYIRDLPAGQYVLHYQNGKTIIKRQLKIEK